MKTYRARKIGKEIKRHTSKNMVGIKPKTKTASLKNEISKLHSNQKSAIRELKLDVKKLENTMISPLGLDKISSLEIEKIQDNRNRISLRLVNVISNIVASSRKLSYLENRHQTK